MNPEKPLAFDRLQYIDINKIRPNPYNPREKSAFEDLTEIKKSLLEVDGILVPLVVLQINDKEEYIILDGERRWRAACELSEKYSQFKKVPANIVRGSLNKVENFEIMFNIHMERKQWSFAAQALAIEEIMKDREFKSDREVADTLHTIPSTIRAARAFNKMPNNLKIRSLNGELDEYYLIFLSQNLDVIKDRYLELNKKYDFDEVSRNFIKKVDYNLIKSADDFRLLSIMAKKCINYNEKELFMNTFDKMYNDVFFTPKDAEKYIDENLGSKIDDLFIKRCNDFYKSLDSYFKTLKSRNILIPKTVNKILFKISDKLNKKLKNNL
jgi:ParB family chromosome partitioning protein